MMNRILVTGGCGYLGSQLIRDLARDSAGGGLTIRILDNLQAASQQALMDLPDTASYELVEGDVLDPSVLRVALRGVDAVVHLAAIVRTPLSFEQPNWVEQVNHWGTSHLVEACLDAGVETFIYASSAAVYGPGGPFDEESPCRPMGTYATSKRAAERAVLTAAERGLEPVVLRIGTLFGAAPVTRFDAVVNKFAYIAGVRRALTVYGDGEQRRPVVHVRDASDAIRWFLEHRGDIRPAIVNVVGANPSVIDVVDAITELRPHTQVRYTEQDIRTHLSFETNGEKLRALGWQPSHSLKDGIAELLDGFRGFEALALQGR